METQSSKGRGVTEKSDSPLEAVIFIRTHLGLNDISFEELGEGIIAIGNESENYAVQVFKYNPHAHKRPQFSTFYGEVIDRGRIINGTFESNEGALLRYNTKTDEPKILRYLNSFKK